MCLQLPDHSVVIRICLQCGRPWFDSWVGKIPWRRDRLPTQVFLGFPCGSTGIESACNARDLGSMPGLYSGLENSMDCSLSGPSVMGFSRQECWSGLPFPSPRDLPDPGIEPGSPALQADSYNN